MNSFWPAAARLSCIQPRITSQSYHGLNSLAARLARQSTRRYSIMPWLFRRKYPPSSTVRVLGRQYVELYQSKARLGIRPFSSQRITARYEELPQNYKDENGLKFRAEPFTEAETLALFGPDYTVDNANRLLRILHGRRVAGTLADPDMPNYQDIYPWKTQLKALEWLRKNVPVDEVLCAGLRAEQELASLDEYIVEDAERTGLYKPNGGERTIKNGKKRAVNKKEQEAKASVYGESGLDYIRKLNKERSEREEAERLRQKIIREEEQKQQSRKIHQKTGEIQPASGATVELPRPMNPRLAYYHKRAQLTDAMEAPTMTITQRLWPSSLLVLAVLVLCTIFPLVYRPPKNSDRMFPEIPPAAATVLMLVAANCAIYMLWRFPPAWRIGNKYFISTPGVPRPLSLIGCTFSHQKFSHLFTNMLFLFLIGTRLHDEVGRANFLSIYIASGVVGSMASLASWTLRGTFTSTALGASGSVCGIIAAILWLRKDDYMHYFFLPDPEKSSIKIVGLVPLVLIIGMDILAMRRSSFFQNTTIQKIDHWAHLGGYATGIAGAEVLKRRLKRRQKAEAERRRNLGLMGKIKEGKL